MKKQKPPDGHRGELFHNFSLIYSKNDDLMCSLDDGDFQCGTSEYKKCNFAFSLKYLSCSHSTSANFSSSKIKCWYPANHAKRAASSYSFTFFDSNFPAPYIEKNHPNGKYLPALQKELIAVPIAFILCSNLSSTSPPSSRIIKSKRSR